MTWPVKPKSTLVALVSPNKKKILYTSQSRMVPIGMRVYFKDNLRQGKMVSAQTKDSRILYERLFSTILIISSVAAGRPVGLVTFQVLWQCSCYVIHSWSFDNMVLL